MTAGTSPTQKPDSPGGLALLRGWLLVTLLLGVGAAIGIYGKTELGGSILAWPPPSGPVLGVLAALMAGLALLFLTALRWRAGLTSEDLFEPVLGPKYEPVLVRGKKAVYGTSARFQDLANIQLPTWIPVAITTLGILGTFWGIADGVQGISLGDSGKTDEQIKALINGVTPIVEGMKTAFGTSLVGMASAVGLLFLDAVQRWRVGAYLDRLKNSKVVHLVQTEDILLLADPQAQGETAKTLSLELKQTVAALKGAVVSFNVDALGDRVGLVIAREFQPVFSDVRLAVKELGAIKADNGQALIREMLADLTQNVLVPMAGQITQVTEAVTQSTATTLKVNASVEKMAREVDQVATSLKQTVQAFQETQKESLDRLERYASALNQQQGEFLTRSQAVFVEAGDQFRSLGTEVRQTLEVQTEHQRDMLGQVHSRFERMLGQMNEVFDTVSREVAGTLATAKEALVSTIHEIPAMLEQTRVAGQAELEKFRTAYQAALEDFFSQQTSLLEESLGRQREGLASVVTHLTEAFAQEAEHREVLGKEVAEQLRDLENIALATTASAQATLSTWTKELQSYRGGLSKSLEQARLLSEHLDGALTGFAEAHRDSMDSMQAGLAGAFSGFDKAVIAVCTQLAQAAHIIASAKLVTHNQVEGRA